MNNNKPDLSSVDIIDLSQEIYDRVLAASDPKLNTVVDVPNLIKNGYAGTGIAASGIQLLKLSLYILERIYESRDEIGLTQKQKSSLEKETEKFRNDIVAIREELDSIEEIKILNISNKSKDTAASNENQ